MSLPPPHAGLVVGYSYLWAEEHQRGHDEGVKNRPCAIVVARRYADEKTIVTVVPVTHSPPRNIEEAIELPAALKTHLGLYTERSWIILNEYNEFLWPGPDLRQTATGAFSYGVLPPGFFIQMRNRMLELAKARRVRHVGRTD